MKPYGTSNNRTKRSRTSLPWLSVYEALLIITSNQYNSHNNSSSNRRLLFSLQTTVIYKRHFRHRLCLRTIPWLFSNINSNTVNHLMQVVSTGSTINHNILTYSKCSTLYAKSLSPVLCKWLSSGLANELYESSFPFSVMTITQTLRHTDALDRLCSRGRGYGCASKGVVSFWTNHWELLLLDTGLRDVLCGGRDAHSACSLK